MTDWWNRLMYRIFAGDPPVDDPSLQSNLQWEPPWGAWLTILLIAAAVGFFYWIYRRETGGRSWGTWLCLVALRLGLVAVLLFMLYGLRVQPYKTDSPDLVLVVDDTLSMTHIDELEPQQQSLVSARVDAAGFENTSRWNQTLTLLTEENRSWLRRISDRYNTRAYFMGESGRPLTATNLELVDELAEHEPTGEVSRLGDSLTQIMEQQRGRPTAAMVVITDGVTIEGLSLSEAAQQAAIRGIPLYGIGLGNRLAARDLRVDDVMVDPVAFVGDTTTFTARISAEGLAGEQATVVLRKKGETENLGEESFSIVADQLTREIRFRHRPEEVGTFEFEIVAQTAAKETTKENNLATRTVTVRDETIKALLVQGYPNFQFRFLKTLLQRQLKRQSASGEPERAFELTTVLQEADQAYIDQDETAVAGFPASRDELFQYDVVILGDSNPSFLNRNQLENLAAYVQEKGGGLVMVAGPRYLPTSYRGTPIEDLFPFRLEDVRAPSEDEVLGLPLATGLTELGTKSPPLALRDSPADNIVTWHTIPHVYWRLEVREPKSAAQTLVEVPSDAGTRSGPLLTQQFIGRGKVLFLGTDDLWRWEYHDDFWMQIIRYLARSGLREGGAAAQLTVDRSSFRVGEPVRVRVRFLEQRLAPVEDDGVQLNLERPDGGTRRVTMSRVAGNRELFEASLPGLMAGDYRLSIAQPFLLDERGQPNPPTTQFTVEAVLGEMARLEMDESDMKKMASASGGRYFGFLEADQIIDLLPEGRQVRIETLSPEPIWNSWILAQLFVLMIISEWLLRKRMGLL